VPTYWILKLRRRCRYCLPWCGVHFSVDRRGAFCPIRTGTSGLVWDQILSKADRSPLDNVERRDAAPRDHWSASRWIRGAPI
jgi:hypothetical protein